MLCREIIAVCSQIRTKHISTLCGQNAELLTDNPGGTYSDHWAFKCKGNFVVKLYNPVNLAKCGS